jgi:hypothetical protein
LEGGTSGSSVEGITENLGGLFGNK